MKVRSNLLGDIVSHYKQLMSEKFDERETRYQLYWLIEHVLSIPASEIPIRLDKRVSESDMLKIHFGVKDLLKDRPIQHIVGEVEFHACNLKVNEHTLIPRPETEELVDLIIKSGDTFNSVLDIGTGSGAIAIALSKHLKSEVTAIEKDKATLAVALENAVNNKVEIGFLQMDFLDKKVWQSLDLSFDLIVSNPPYVRNSEKEQMADNVLDYEPHLALFVENDNPLVFYEMTLEFALKNLNNDGHIWLEINEYLAKETAALFEAHFPNVEIIQDFRGKDRFVHCW